MKNGDIDAHRNWKQNYFDSHRAHRGHRGLI